MGSAWRHSHFSPLAGSGQLIPVVINAAGKQTFDYRNHGTAFFISPFGFFLTAGHVIDDHPEGLPMVVMTTWADGVRMNEVIAFVRHPTSDIAFGIARLKPQPQIQPWTLSRTPLSAGANVAVFGYPRTQTKYNDSDEDPAARFRFTCDYYDGKVLDHCPGGVGLARWPAYVTDISSGLSPDLAGASGGPMICPDTLKVHGLLCSSSDSYAVCTDVAAVFDWEVFEHEVEGPLTLGYLATVNKNIIRAE